VRSHLPAPPAAIAEIGCGRLGGFVPNLLADGYDAVGIDPVAPEGDSYRRVQVEHAGLPAGLDGVIACTSLHHVADPSEVLGKVADALAPGGVLVVVEWDWEGFDEATARWCFERLAAEPESWLHHRRDGWRASGQGWEQYLRSWAGDHGLHGARGLLDALDQRFDRVQCERAPYFFAELDGATEAEELDAINAGRIRALRIDYVGRRV
jgi:SAM-dependent methyltransferase